MTRPSKPIALVSVLMAGLLCVFTSCSPQDDVKESDSSASVTSEMPTSEASPSVPESVTEPIATGFTTLTRELYSILGCGSEQGYYETFTDESIGKQFVKGVFSAGVSL